MLCCSTPVVKGRFTSGGTAACRRRNHKRGDERLAGQRCKNPDVDCSPLKCLRRHEGSPRRPCIQSAFWLGVCGATVRPAWMLCCRTPVMKECFTSGGTAACPRRNRKQGGERLPGQPCKKHHMSTSTPTQSFSSECAASRRPANEAVLALIKCPSERSLQAACALISGGGSSLPRPSGGRGMGGARSRLPAGWVALCHGRPRNKRRFGMIGRRASRKRGVDRLTAHTRGAVPVPRRHHCVASPALR